MCHGSISEFWTKWTMVFKNGLAPTKTSRILFFSFCMGSNFTPSNKDLMKFVQKFWSILRNMFFYPRFCKHFQKQWIHWHFWTYVYAKLFLFVFFPNIGNKAQFFSCKVLWSFPKTMKTWAFLPLPPTKKKQNSFFFLYGK